MVNQSMKNGLSHTQSFNHVLIHVDSWHEHWTPGTDRPLGSKDLRGQTSDFPAVLEAHHWGDGLGSLRLRRKKYRSTLHNTTCGLAVRPSKPFHYTGVPEGMPISQNTV